MSKVGLMTKEEEKFFFGLAAEELAEKAPVMLRPGIKLVVPMIGRGVDNKWGDRIPEPWQSYIEILVTKVYDAMQDNVVTMTEAQDVATYCAEISNKEIDLPLFDEDSEALMFLGGWKFLATLMYQWAVKKKREIEDAEAEVVD